MAGRKLEVLRQDASPADRRKPPGRWGMAKDASTLVSVLLWEGDLEAAWESADEGDHPADSLPVYQRHIETTVQQKSNKSYEEAVVWIRRACALMTHLGRHEEFATYVASVRATHEPKRNLMKLLDREGW